MKVLFLVPYPTEGASNRFRVEQYLPYLKEKGIIYTVRPFVFSNFYKILYLKGHVIKKIFYFYFSTVARIFDLIRALRYDIVFIHRESYPFGPPFIERVLKFFKKRIIFDFDDAIFLPASSGTNAFVERFNRYGKIPEVIALSDRVIAGNRYLADFALKYNENIDVIPTPVDTEKYKPLTAQQKPVTSNQKPETERIVIGWIGSKTTSVFLGSIRNTLTGLLDRYPNLEIAIVGGEFDNMGRARMRTIPWSLENEIRDLQRFDIGIMPMPDTRWTRGKCAFKAILYMSVGIPCVCSPVGVTAEIIKEGVNGFLANSPEDWERKLSMLIESADLRSRIGENARKTTVGRFSVAANASRFMKVLEQVNKK